MHNREKQICHIDHSIQYTISTNHISFFFLQFRHDLSTQILKISLNIYEYDMLHICFQEYPARGKWKTCQRNNEWKDQFVNSNKIHVYISLRSCLLSQITVCNDLECDQG